MTPSYLRAYAALVAGLALGLIVARALFGLAWNHLGAVLVGAMVGALYAASRVVEREVIEVREGVVRGPGPLWGRRSIAVDRLDRVKSAQRSVVDRVCFVRWLWFEGGCRIRINLLAHRRADVDGLLRSLGCE